MHRFNSTASRIVFLHIIAVALTAVFMPLVLFWMLSQETRSLHQRAMEEQASTIARLLSVSSDGQLVLDLSPALKAEFSQAYGRYFYAGSIRRKTVVFLGAGGDAVVSPRSPLLGG